MNIIEIARQSGMLVLLDAKIGHEEYHSISASLSALERFAAAVRESATAGDASHGTGISG
ncbi:hypothetical protein GNZ12_38090 [Paraburkholderia sp. 1N]|uniref:Uncharacterized protein n=1 Tax=Paraburkholderia solitsugae TaxID=2675748 RepID=A0ABX2C3W6_9BURK|nr:hypothetical protein [Paraburkholderia solitsugae]NPT47008.1 hypothetical protein [Paraburkholderia solitsugae]